jgi:hypothetical protein
MNGAGAIEAGRGDRGEARLESVIGSGRSRA